MRIQIAMNKTKTQINSNEDRLPQFVTSDGHPFSQGYASWLANLKKRYVHLQAKAAVKVNTELLHFYWTLGKDIVAMHIEEQWGKGVLKQLSLDLRASFPEQTGFSLTNLKYIKRWYAFYEGSEEIGQQAADQLGLPLSFASVPWFHHIVIITHSKSVREALFYINKVLEGNWSRRMLEDIIKANLYENHGNIPSNFSGLLPDGQSQLVLQTLKDPYNLNFLRLSNGYNEAELEDALVSNITRFLLELGHGFAYVGRQMELRMPGGQSFFPDMVFYHIPLKCYVVVELKVVDFIPEFAGKLNFYVSAADHLLRGKDDNPSIGLLICKAKDDTVVEWSLQDINKPIGVSSYQLQEVVKRTFQEMEHNDCVDRDKPTGSKRINE